MMILGVRLFAFLHVSLFYSLTGRSQRQKIPALQGWVHHHRKRITLSAIVVLFLAPNERSVSAKQLNMHNYLAKLSTFSFKSHPKYLIYANWPRAQ